MPDSTPFMARLGTFPSARRRRPREGAGVAAGRRSYTGGTLRFQNAQSPLPKLRMRRSETDVSSRLARGRMRSCGECGDTRRACCEERGEGRSRGGSASFHSPALLVSTLLCSFLLTLTHPHTRRPMPHLLVGMDQPTTGNAATRRAESFFGTQKDRAQINKDLARRSRKDKLYYSKETRWVYII